MMVSHVTLMLIVQGEFVGCQKLHVPVQIAGQHHRWRTVRDMNVVHIDIVQHQQGVLHQHNTDVLRDIMEEP